MDWRWTDSLGVALRGRDLPGRTTDLARAAERAGLGSLWIIEDYFDPGAYALAGAAAAVTERIVIGLGVVNPYTRHPALVAMETAALAGVAPGRIVLGMGSSNRKWIEEQMAIPFKTPLRGRGVRRARRGARRSAAGAGTHPARRQGAARARARRRSRGRRALLRARLAGSRATRPRHHVVAGSRRLQRHRLRAGGRVRRPRAGARLRAPAQPPLSRRAPRPVHPGGRRPGPRADPAV